MRDGETAELGRGALADDSSGVFRTTRWTVIAAAGCADPVRSAAALEELCRKYWYPIYAFVRRRGAEPFEAEDLTQSFFQFVLEREALKHADRRRGKFRTFLLTTLTNFLRNEWDRRTTMKRGGGQPVLSLDELEPEERYRLEPVDKLTPEKLFERRWALTLLEQVLTRLQLEYRDTGREEVFGVLEPALTGEVSQELYATAQCVLGISSGAARVAVHRLRRRFGELLRAEIAQTVSGPFEVEEEIRHLFAAIAD